MENHRFLDDFPIETLMLSDVISVFPCPSFPWLQEEQQARRQKVLLYGSEGKGEGTKHLVLVFPWLEMEGRCG